MTHLEPKQTNGRRCAGRNLSGNVCLVHRLILSGQGYDPFKTRQRASCELLSTQIFEKENDYARSRDGSVLSSSGLRNRRRLVFASGTHACKLDAHGCISASGNIAGETLVSSGPVFFGLHVYVALASSLAAVFADVGISWFGEQLTNSKIGHLTAKLTQTITGR